MVLTSGTLSPIQAYEELMRFASRFGEVPLRLAFHAAVPQSFKPDLLHLIKRNFVPDAKDESTAEADVLLSPLCKNIGRGYFQFDANVRHLLLDNLAESYAFEPVPRIERVANFLLWYVTHSSRLTSGSNDRLWREYLETQRWVALAFIDPESAATQFAQCLDQSVAEDDVVTRLQLGGLAASLSAPLAGYSHLLNYASALQTLEIEGLDETVQKYGDFLEREITIGELKLRPASRIIEEKYGPLKPKEEPAVEIQAAEDTEKVVGYGSVFISHSSVDKPFVRKLAKEFEKRGIKAWVDEAELVIGDSLMDYIEDGIKKAEYFAIVLSKNSINSSWVEAEFRATFNLELENKIRVLPILIDDVEVPLFLKDKLYCDFRSSANFTASFEQLLRVFIKSRKKVALKSSGSIPTTLYPNHFLPDLKFFVGRESLLENIRETLNKDHRVAMHEISGLGKTFTTYKFVEENQGTYERIFFIRATKEEWLESLARCGEIVNPELASLTDQTAKALGFKQWLETNEKWLVVYDNVDSPSELYSFVPVNKRGDCIFTSNVSEVVRLGTEINIAKLDKTDAEILLYSRAVNRPFSIPELEGEELEAFNRIIEEIDGLPVTLSSTGALIYEKNWTFDRFWKKYDTTAKIAWESEDPFDSYQRKSAGKVFSLAYDELSSAGNTGDAVKILLNAVSFLAPEEIPADFLKLILQRFHEPFTTLEGQDDLWDDVREKLVTYDVLKYDRQKNEFTTHRSIQRVIISRLQTNEQRMICDGLSEILLSLFPEFDYSNQEVCEKYYPHALNLLENSSKLSIESESIIDLYSRLGRYQELLNNSAPAQKFYLHAAEISAAIFGVESEHYSANLSHLARIYLYEGRYDEAMDAYERALRIDEKTIGREHPGYAIRLSNLAGVYQSQGRYDEAIEKYEEALRINEKAIGREHPNYAASLSNLAGVYQSQGKYDEAIEKYEEVLRIGEKTIGREHPNYATGLSNLAGVYQSQGRYAEAIEKYKEALRIDEKTTGREHQSYATHLNGLALSYEGQENFGEALKSYEEALRIFEKTLPEGHSYVEQGRKNVANCREKFERSPWTEPPWIYVIYDISDLMASRRLEDLIQKEGYGIFPSRAYLESEDRREWDKTHRAWLIKCDAVLIYSQKAPYTWLLNKVLELQKIKANRKGRKFCAIGVFFDGDRINEPKDILPNLSNLLKIRGDSELPNFFDLLNKAYLNDDKQVSNL